MVLDIKAAILVLGLVAGALAQITQKTPSVWFPEQCRVASTRTDCTQAAFRAGCPTYCPYECPSSGWTKSGTDCFAVNLKAVDWYDAAVLCKSYGGTLAPASTETRQTVLTSMQSSRSADRWHGLSRNVNNAAFSWYYNDNTFSYTTWLPNEPAMTIPGCGYFSGADSQKRWAVASCTDQRFYACYVAATLAPV